MRGGFRLRRVGDDPLFTFYELEDIAFTAGSGGRHYEVRGRGSYAVGGEVALRQQLFLELVIDDGFNKQACYLINDSPKVERLWPMLKVALVQTNGSFTQVYHLELNVAPFREIWFSTVNGMTPGIWSPPTNHLSGGDFLSSAGRVVKSNHELTRSLNVMPIAPDLGLDAVDVLPGGEILFSIQTDIFSETLGPLHHGDLLFSRSSQPLRNADLLVPVTGGIRPLFDVGLDAVQALSEGQFYFSVCTNLIIFNDPLPIVVIRPGDLLFTDLVNEQGRVAKRNLELLARFQPVDAVADLGLDAFYLWPSGEIWFSIERGFQDRQLGAIQAGDLLSDQGYVVYRNLELVGAFQPLEDLADFGLDGLFIVTDAMPPQPSPIITHIRHRQTSGLELEWEGKGRVWQVQRSSPELDAWAPASPILPDLEYRFPNVSEHQAFYRLVQW